MLAKRHFPVLAGHATIGECSRYLIPNLSISTYDAFDFKTLASRKSGPKSSSIRSAGIGNITHVHSFERRIWIVRAQSQENDIDLSAEYLQESTFADPTTTLPYDYQSAQLLTEHDSIRILELLPGKLQDPVACRLHVHNLSTAPPFEALSYVWGHRYVKNAILVDGRTHHFGTSNARQALRRLRYIDKVSFIWIDSICINQKDEREKERQIQLMPQIYRQAEETIIWLGTSFTFKMFDWSSKTLAVFWAWSEAARASIQAEDIDHAIVNIAKTTDQDEEWIKSRLTQPKAYVDSMFATMVM
ncbi:hypothetical protein G7054_g4439 [Neopestalotiopsis clavispora]|nr:hypothetical protein G7054_g4439 [Neopestalotiopsis clavispora]